MLVNVYDQPIKESVKRHLSAGEILKIHNACRLSTGTKLEV